MRPTIAYFVNQYPKVSHTFIRREILALERLGFPVHRIALRGWDAELVDPEDRAEQAKTRYVLAGGTLPLLGALAKVAVTSPLRFLAALRLAWRMGRRSDRPLPYHLVYLGEAARMLGWLRSSGAMHVHAHFGTNSTEVVMLAQCLGGPPYSFTAHGPEEFDKATILGLDEKIRRAAFVVAISSFGKSQLCRWTSHDQWSKVAVVHCGLDRPFFDVPPVPIPDAPRLVCVGRLSEQKGHLLLVEAAHQLAVKGVPFELVLAGDGEMRAEVEALALRFGLGDRLRITGWISSDGVRKEILAARALVLPSFAEGLPVAVMEAMALRRPVLTTYVGGIPELVRHRENGWLFPAGSVDGLVDAMAECLRTPAGRLQQMGDAAHESAVARHSIDTEAARLAALFPGGSPANASPAGVATTPATARR